MVVALSNNVKIITDTARLVAIIAGRNHLFLSWSLLEIVPPTITGRSGNIQGAATVHTPAMNDIKSSVISIDFLQSKKKSVSHKPHTSSPIFQIRLL